MTNIPAEPMPTGEVIASYHDLRQVEASFRTPKTDQRARPTFHHTRDATEAHQTIEPPDLSRAVGPTRMG